MQLTPQNFRAWLAFDRADQRPAVRDALQALPPDALADRFLALDDAGHPLARCRVIRASDQVTIITSPDVQPDAPPATIIALLAAAMRQAQSKATPLIASRILATAASQALSDALTHLGFSCHGTRIEYRAQVADLPDDVGSPLTWRDLSVVGEQQAAAMLARVSQGDPHGLGLGEDPLLALRGHLQDEGLRSEPACVQLGSLDGALVAFVCAQVAPRSGWSRITYMGLVPAARGEGLGRWVHRRGFAMLKAQDGVLYHGGTAADNVAMKSLFLAHGCQEHRRMTEWLWQRAAPRQEQARGNSSL